MNHLTIQDPQWRRQKAKLKLLFTHLNDGDFNYDYGKKEVMMINLQAKLTKSRKELNAILAGL